MTRPAAEKIACWAHGANNLVVMLEVPCDGGHWQLVVWRNAVTVRTSGNTESPRARSSEQARGQ